MEPTYNFVDKIYDFKGQWGVPSKCGLKIVKKPDKTIVIATELVGENPGTSVTNFCAGLALAVMNDFNIPREGMLFIEHNPEMNSKLSMYHETFDMVSFDWDGEKFTNPDWKRITPDEFQKLITE